jgi:hypothetical protein
MSPARLRPYYRCVHFTRQAGGPVSTLKRGYRSDAVVLEDNFVACIAGFKSTSHFPRDAFDFTVAPGGTFLYRPQMRFCEPVLARPQAGAAIAVLP